MTEKHPSTKWVLWSLAAIFYFYEFVLRVSPNVMAQELMKSFSLTASSFGILSAFYLYTYAPMQLPVGLLMDKFGIKKVLSIASVICGLGALLFAVSQSFAMACFGRSLIGASSAFGFIAMIYISSHWFPPKQRAFLIGIANSLAMLGAAAGTGPLSNVIDHYGWRKTLLTFGVFGIALGFCIYFILRQDKHSEKVEKETEKTSPRLLEGIKSVCKNKTNWINAIVALLFYMSTTAFGGLWGASFIQTAYGVSKETAGYAVSMIFLGWLVGGPVMGLLSDFLGKRKSTIRIGLIGALASLIPVLYLPCPIILVYVLLFLLGFFSSAELLNFSLAIETNKPHVKATAAAFINFIISCSDSVIQPFVGFILDLKWNGQMEGTIRSYALQDYRLALSCLPISLLLGFILLFWIRERIKT